MNRRLCASAVKAQNLTVTLLVHVVPCHADTVIVLWIKQILVLRVNPKTGPFVYMLTRMLQDVLTWMLIYICFALAWSAGLYVLYRNQVCLAR